MNVRIELSRSSSEHEVEARELAQNCSASDVRIDDLKAATRNKNDCLNRQLAASRSDVRQYWVNEVQYDANGRPRCCL